MQRNNNQKERKGATGIDLFYPIIHAEVCPDILALTERTEKLGQWSQQDRQSSTSVIREEMSKQVPAVRLVPWGPPPTYWKFQSQRASRTALRTALRSWRAANTSQANLSKQDYKKYREAINCPFMYHVWSRPVVDLRLNGPRCKKVGNGTILTMWKINHVCNVSWEINVFKITSLLPRRSWGTN